MGSFYNFKCAHCGYSFEAKYGNGYESEKENLAIKNIFEKGRADKRLQGIFDTLRETVSEEESRDWQKFITHYSVLTGEELKNKLLFFKPPLVFGSWCVYECSNCREFFMHKRISMKCDIGEFEQRYIECPTCGDSQAEPVDEEEYNLTYFRCSDDCLCEVLCPKCNEYLTVTSCGLWD